jgi:hypothetical protein
VDPAAGSREAVAVAKVSDRDIGTVERVGRFSWPQQHTHAITARQQASNDPAAERSTGTSYENHRLPPV